MNELKNIAKEAQNILICGHVRADGDCSGACVATYHYLKSIYSDKNIEVYLDRLPEKYAFLDEERNIISNSIKQEKYDLFIALDCGSPDMLGEALQYFRTAKTTVCVDHHISNKGYAGINFTDASASSACEVLFDLMAYEDINFKVAEALYIGIAYDTGVFKRSNTSGKTFEIVGKLIERGIPFWEYIDKCFNQRTYTQTQLLGRVLLESMLLMDGKCIVAKVTRRMLEFYSAKTEDIEGIIDQLRVNKGVEVAILLHETGEQEYKVSLRSNNIVDVSKIAVYFGGGGHIKAAGFTMRGSAHDVINNVTEHIETQFEESNKG